MRETTGGEEEEDEELVPRRRILLGMKFHDEESRNTAKKVGIASATLGGLVVAHFIIHLIKRGRIAHAFPHMVLGLLLPFIGWRGATLEEGTPWRPRLTWIFHIGNVVFVILHAVVLIVVCIQVLQLLTASVDSMCNWETQDDPLLRPASARGPEVMPTMPPMSDSYRACRQDVETEKAHAPGLMFTWLLMSLPYWLCAAYAAYYSHELYFQLRIRELEVHREHGGGADEEGRSLATVGWAEAAVE